MISDIEKHISFEAEFIGEQFYCKCEICGNGIPVVWAVLMQYWSGTNFQTRNTYYTCDDCLKHHLYAILADFEQQIRGGDVVLVTQP